jgi:hypothetical protein
MSTSRSARRRSAANAPKDNGPQPSSPQKAGPAPSTRSSRPSTATIPIRRQGAPFDHRPAHPPGYTALCTIPHRSATARIGGTSLTHLMSDAREAQEDQLIAGAVMTIDAGSRAPSVEPLARGLAATADRGDRPALIEGPVHLSIPLAVFWRPSDAARTHDRCRQIGIHRGQVLENARRSACGRATGQFAPDSRAGGDGVGDSCGDRPTRL